MVEAASSSEQPATRIRELVAELDGRRLEVVTSDRALAADIRPSVQAVTAKRFLTSLDEAGC